MIWVGLFAMLAVGVTYFSTSIHKIKESETSNINIPPTSSEVMDIETESDYSIINYYVSPKGKDTNLGTEDSPFASIQKAIDLVEPGGHVFLLEGVYYQTVSLTKSGSSTDGYISLQNAVGQTAIMDGEGLKQVDGGVISIMDASYVRVSGIEIMHYRTKSAEATPTGIMVSGGGSHIEIIGNRIHDMGTNAGKKAGGGNAHGIAVYGDSPTPLQQVTINQNELYNLKLGASEALVVNGNVDGFQIVQNIVHDNNNIGIDVIGFEAVAPSTEQDQARNGLVQGNNVYNNSSFGNAAYGKEYSAAGIYVDGGKDIEIKDNDIHHNDFGIELASEHADGSTSNVNVSFNHIYNNRASGITLGGYDEYRGWTENCIITDNRFIENNSLHYGYGEINLAYDTRNNEVSNNYIRPNEDGIMITNEFTNNKGNKFDYNQYSSSDEAYWQWKGEEFNSFASYQLTTGNDTHSEVVN